MDGLLAAKARLEQRGFVARRLELGPGDRWRFYGLAGGAPTRLPGLTSVPAARTAVCGIPAERAARRIGKFEIVPWEREFLDGETQGEGAWTL